MFVKYLGYLEYFDRLSISLVLVFFFLKSHTKICTCFFLTLQFFLRKIALGDPSVFMNVLVVIIYPKLLIIEDLVCKFITSTEKIYYKTFMFHLFLNFAKILIVCVVPKKRSKTVYT